MQRWRAEVVQVGVGAYPLSRNCIRRSYQCGRTVLNARWHVPVGLAIGRDWNNTHCSFPKTVDETAFGDENDDTTLYLVGAASHFTDFFSPLSRSSVMVDSRDICLEGGAMVNKRNLLRKR